MSNVCALRAPRVTSECIEIFTTKQYRSRKELISTEQLQFILAICTLSSLDLLILLKFNKIVCSFSLWPITAIHARLLPRVGGKRVEVEGVDFVILNRLILQIKSLEPTRLPSPWNGSTARLVPKWHARRQRGEVVLGWPQPESASAVPS